MVTSCTAGARRASIDNEHYPSNPSRRIPGVSTRCTAMYWNGPRIVRTTPTMGHRPIGRPGIPEIAVAVSFAAVPGTTLRISLARPSASDSTPSIGPTPRASGSQGRLRLEGGLEYRVYAELLSQPVGRNSHSDCANDRIWHGRGAMAYCDAAPCRGEGRRNTPWRARARAMARLRPTGA